MRNRLQSLRASLREAIDNLVDQGLLKVSSDAEGSKPSWMRESTESDFDMEGVLLDDPEVEGDDVVFAMLPQSSNPKIRITVPALVYVDKTAVNLRSLSADSRVRVIGKKSIRGLGSGSIVYASKVIELD